MTTQAPGELELLRSFVNTKDPDTDTDALDSPEGLADWLSRHNLLAPDSPVSPADHQRVLRFRESVRSLALANLDGDLDEETVTTLNRIVEPSLLSVHIGPDGSPTLRPRGEGVDLALGRLLSALYNAMVDGSWYRLKACSNDACRWLYYDHSKNRSKKWCTMETCGNVINARAYRQRRRDADA